MKSGNASYETPDDLPDTLPVFPLAGALLLPSGQLPLNIFEPRYLAMTDHAIASHRLITMVQPDLSGEKNENGDPLLCRIGCIGRITAFQETGDGRYLISLAGICRCQLGEELPANTPFRQVNVRGFENDLNGRSSAVEVDRPALLCAFRNHLEANGMEADWESVNNADNETLVTALSMMSPFGPAEKQALLEAEDIRARAETLIAISEIELAKNSGCGGSNLQ